MPGVWRSPSTWGVGMAVAAHGMLVVIFLLIQVSVRPMAAPPLEVELLSGDVLSEDARTSTPAQPRDTGGLLERAGEIEPLPVPTTKEALLPDLPSATMAPRAYTPSWSSTDPSPAGPSPGPRLAPLPVRSLSPTHAQGVKVKVEGTLSTRALVHGVEPAFPPGAPSGGVVKVRLVVPPDGTVRSAALVLKAHPALDDAALEAVRQWRFEAVATPGDATGVVTVEFVLR